MSKSRERKGSEPRNGLEIDEIIAILHRLKPEDKPDPWSLGWTYRDVTPQISTDPFNAIVDHIETGVRREFNAQGSLDDLELAFTENIDHFFHINEVVTSIKQPHARELQGGQLHEKDGVLIPMRYVYYQTVFGDSLWLRRVIQDPKLGIVSPSMYHQMLARAKDPVLVGRNRVRRLSDPSQR